MQKSSNTFQSLSTFPTSSILWQIQKKTLIMFCPKIHLIRLIKLLPKIIYSQLSQFMLPLGRKYHFKEIMINSVYLIHSQTAKSFQKINQIATLFFTQIPRQQNIILALNRNRKFSLLQQILRMKSRQTKRMCFTPFN